MGGGLLHGNCRTTRSPLRLCSSGPKSYPRPSNRVNQQGPIRRSHVLGSLVTSSAITTTPHPPTAPVPFVASCFPRLGQITFTSVRLRAPHLCNRTLSHGISQANGSLPAPQHRMEPSGCQANWSFGSNARMLKVQCSGCKTTGAVPCLMPKKACPHPALFLRHHATVCLLRGRTGARGMSLGVGGWAGISHCLGLVLGSMRRWEGVLRPQTLRHTGYTHARHASHCLSGTRSNPGAHSVKQDRPIVGRTTTTHTRQPPHTQARLADELYSAIKQSKN